MRTRRITLDACPRPRRRHAPRSNPSIVELLVAFAIIALSGFGGVLYWSRRMMVEQRKWMTAEEFNEAYALCNFLPGPNIVNFSVVFGRRFARHRRERWWRCSVCSAPPMAIVIVFGMLYAQYGTIDALQRMFAASPRRPRA